MRFNRLLGLLVFLVLFTGVLGSIEKAQAETVVYGPKVFTRMAGTPNEYTETINLPSLNGEFLMVVRNGESDWGKISSAIVKLNGLQVLGPNAFNQNVGTLVVPIEPQATNELYVELRSAPGNSIQVSIVSSEDLAVVGEINGICIKPDGTVASNAQVTVQFPATGETFQTTTSEEGIFNFTDIPKAGNFVVNVESIDGHTGSTNSYVTETSPTANVTVALSPPGSGVVSGTVTQATGATVPNAVVSINFMETDFTATVLTTAEGYYKFTGIPTDGSMIVTAFDTVTAAFGSEFSYLTQSYSQRTLNVRINTPQGINSQFSNGDFGSGGLEGWETKGDVRIVPKNSVFPPETSTMTTMEAETEATMSTMAVATAAATAGCNPSPYSALVTTAGDSNAVGLLTQTFSVSPGQDTLTGRIRFVSDEWPRWYGTQFNDSYAVTLTTPGGTKLLSRGNLNTSSWGAGVSGFNGAVAEVSVTVDVSSFVGQAVTLSIQVSDVGDKIIDSGVVVSDFKIVDRVSRNYHSSGSWNSDATITGSFGQVVWITVKNVNVLGTGIEIEVNRGGVRYKQSHLLPYVPITFNFSDFGEEPMGWTFNITPKADAFIVNYTIESTWVPGMPNNPCY